MRYLSTRGHGPRSFSDIALGGIAPDGGLYVPESFPPLELDSSRNLSYPDLAARILTLLAPERDDWDELANETYTEANFGSEEIAPISPLGDDGLFLLRLSNGPTLAFKDMALQLLGRLFERELAEQGRTMTVLGATSGDTGSAAEAALAGKKGVSVVMLSPLGRTSPFQAAQMYSLLHPNIHNLAVRGVFDQCQDIVKELSADAALKSRYTLGAVNSIHWGRIAAQVVYYVWASLKFDTPVDFVVPSGNFGNVLAGWIAKRMGAPIRRLRVATNENDVLAEFFASGVYRPRGAAGVFETESPSMDISKASNFERFIFEVVGRDSEKTRELFTSPEFVLPVEAFSGEGLSGARTTHEERTRAMRWVWDVHGAMLDPHTAAGVAAADGWREPGVPCICLETALPCKFEAAMKDALGVTPPRPMAFEGLESRPQRVVEVEATPDAVRAYLKERF